VIKYDYTASKLYPFYNVVSTWNICNSRDMM